MPGQYSELLNIPRETARAARAVFGSDNFYILIGEKLAGILEGITFGNPTEAKLESVLSPLVTYFQFLEGLTDIKAIDALRTRIDWKFALHLPVNPPLFRPSMLCKFRQAVLLNSRYQTQYQILIGRLFAISTFQYRQPPGAMTVNLVSHICSLNTLDWIQEAMSQAIEAMACKSPETLRKVALPHWYGRYGRSIPRLEAASAQRQTAVPTQEIRADIRHLLDEVQRIGRLEVNQLREVKVLEQIWNSQFESSNESSDRKHSAVKTLLLCEYCTFRAGGKTLPNSNDLSQFSLRKISNY